MRGLGLLLLLIPLCAQAQMYKCVDERGATRYTDDPAPGCKPAAIRPIPAISGTARPSKDDFATQDAELKRRQLEREANAARERESQGRRCARLREENGRLASGIRIASLNAKGERVYMDDATRDRRLAELAQELRSCP